MKAQAPITNRHGATEQKIWIFLHQELCENILQNAPLRTLTKYKANYVEESRKVHLHWNTHPETNTTKKPLK
jgi:hypothetical protein